MKSKVIVSLSGAAFVVCLAFFDYFRWRYFGFVYPYFHLRYPGTLEFNLGDAAYWTYGMWASAALTIFFGATTIFLFVRSLRRRNNADKVRISGKSDRM